MQLEITHDDQKMPFETWKTNIHKEIWKIRRTFASWAMEDTDHDDELEKFNADEPFLQDCAQSFLEMDEPDQQDAMSRLSTDNCSELLNELPTRLDKEVIKTLRQKAQELRKEKKAQLQEKAEFFASPECFENATVGL